MAILEDLKAGASIRGLSPEGLATVVQVEWYGNQAVNVTFRDAAGTVKQRLVYRADEPTLEVATAGRPWSFDGDGALLRLVSEAYRIRLAHLFDPYLAIHTSRIEALPHQMLPRQPLRFLLADDPGAGKTIMAGLLIKELAIRGDLERCLVVAPGSLVEQWQDELSQKFGLAFDILTRDQIETARTGNPFSERNLWIARLDMLSRDPELQARLRAAKEWDLVICDEADLMAASVFDADGKEVGTVEDLILDEQKKITGVVVGVGGFLGIGKKEVGLNWEQAKLVESADTGKKMITISLTKADLEAAADFKTKAEREAEEQAAAQQQQLQQQQQQQTVPPAQPSQ